MRAIASTDQPRGGRIAAEKTSPPRRVAVEGPTDRDPERTLVIDLDALQKRLREFPDSNEDFERSAREVVNLVRFADGQRRLIGNLPEGEEEPSFTRELLAVTDETFTLAREVIVHCSDGDNPWRTEPEARVVRAIAEHMLDEEFFDSLWAHLSALPPIADHSSGEELL